MKEPPFCSERKMKETIQASQEKRQPRKHSLRALSDTGSKRMRWLGPFSPVWKTSEELLRAVTGDRS